jgi:uncharacterized membrane protein
VPEPQRVNITLSAPVSDAAMQALASAGVEIEANTVAVTAASRDEAVEKITKALQDTGVHATVHAEPPDGAGTTGGLGFVRNLASGAAGAVGLVYVAGGAILALRLKATELPSTAVLGQLPRDFLISLGVSHGLLPGLGAAVLFGGYRGTNLGHRPWEDKLQRRHARSFTDKRNDAGSLSFWNGPAWHVLSAGLVAAAVAGATLVSAAAYERSGESLLSRQPDYYAVLVSGAFVFMFLTLLLYKNLRWRIAKRYVHNYRTAAAVVWHSLLVGGLFVLALIAFWGTRPLPEARVCLKPEPQRAAALGEFFIGETSNRVYVGEGRAIRSVPLDQVRSVRIAPGGGGTC